METLRVTPAILDANTIEGAHARLIATAERLPLHRRRAHHVAHSVDQPAAELSMVFGAERSQLIVSVEGFDCHDAAPAKLTRPGHIAFRVPTYVCFVVSEMREASTPIVHGWVQGEVVAKRAKHRFVIHNAATQLDAHDRSLHETPELWSIALRDVAERCAEADIASVEFANSAPTATVGRLKDLYEFDGYESVSTPRDALTDLPDAVLSFNDSEPRTFTRTVRHLVSGHQLEVVTDKSVRLRAPIVDAVISRISDHLAVFPDVELSILAFGKNDRGYVATTINGIIWFDARELRRHANVDEGRDAVAEIGLSRRVLANHHGTTDSFLRYFIDHEFGHRVTEHVQAVNPFGYARLLHNSLRRLSTTPQKTFGRYAFKAGGIEIDAQLFALSRQVDPPEAARYFYDGLVKLDARWRERAPHAFRRLK